MVVHICERCNKEFNKKSNYLQHLSKKNPCKIKAANTIIMETIYNIDENIIDENIQNFCKYCKNTYSSIYKLKRHFTTCKIKLNSELKQEINQLKDKITILETRSLNKY